MKSFEKIGAGPLWAVGCWVGRHWQRKCASNSSLKIQHEKGVWENFAKAAKSRTEGGSKEYLHLHPHIDTDPNISEELITLDELLFYQYYSEIKLQSMHWKSRSSPSQRKPRQSKSMFKKIMLNIFDIRDSCWLGMRRSDGVPVSLQGSFIHPSWTN